MEKKEITLNKETVDILVTNIIPTTKYFESRFDHLQHQVDEIKKYQHEMKKDIDQKFILIKQDMDNRFEEVNRRFEQIDKRFEQIDKRFEKIDKKFEQIDKKFNEIDKRFEQIDQRFEQIDQRFEQIDKKFEEIDKRFEQVDKRFERIENKIENLTDMIHNLTLEIKKLEKTQEVTLREYIIERDRFYDKKFNNLRMFNIAIISLIAGLALKIFGIFH